MLLSCYYQEKEPGAESLSLGTGTSRASLCHPSSLWFSTRLQHELQRTRALRVLLLLADRPNEQLQAPYPRCDLQTAKKVLFPSKRPAEDGWAGRGFPKHGHSWDFCYSWAPAWHPQSIPIVTAATTCFCIPHRLGVDVINLAGLFPRLQRRRVPAALKKRPWRGKPQARPVPSDRSPAAGTGSPFGEVPYLASPRRFSSGMHLGRAKMRS